MRTIKSLKNQTIWDVAIQYYGSAEAVNELLELNPQLQNDLSSVINSGYIVDSTMFYIELPLKEGSSIKIDEDSFWVRRDVLKEIEEDIITFNLD